MKNGKYMKKRALNVKALALVLTLSLLVCGAIGGTLAWLMDKTDAVTNTFEYGDINIELTETGAEDGEKSYTVVPGAEYGKDPTITVEAGSEKCWLFVKVQETDELNALQYSIDTAIWKEVPGAEGVYFCDVDASTGAVTKTVLTDNKVAINPELTKTEIEDYEGETKLVFTAYAVQYTAANSAKDAWAIAQNNGKTPAQQG